MGAVTDEALRLAHEIVTRESMCDPQMTEYMAAWWRGKIEGLRHLALAMDFDAAWDALPQFDALSAQMKFREVSP